MALFAFLILALITTGKFIDFMLSEPGNRRIKDRLVDFYIFLNDDRWRNCVQISADAVVRFLRHVLGPRILSVRFIYSVALASATVTTIVLVSQNYQGIREETPTGLLADGALAHEISLIYLQFYLTDLLSWSFIIFLLDRIIGSSLLKTTLLASFVCVGWIVSTLIVMVTSAAIIPSFPQNSASDPFSIIASVGHLFELAEIALVVVSLPYVLFVVSVFGSLVLYAVYPAVRTPLSTLLQRAEESKVGVFTLAATALSAIMALLAAAQKAFWE